MKTPLFFLALLTLLTGALFAQEVEKLSEPKTLLFIRTVPKGARVLIDGKQAGATDDLFRVEPGVRRIVIELDGHTPQSKELTIRAGQITRLVLQLKKSELSPETGPLSFTPVIERVVNDDKTGSDWMIDLDTGNLYTPPTELDPEKNPKADTKQLMAWVRQQGIDATGIKAQGGELYFLERVLAIVDKASWESVTQQQVRETLAEVVDPLDKAVVGDTLYAFRTREDGMGVLQVVARGEDSPSVRIRYKLLSRAGTDTDAAAPALRAIINDADSRQGRDSIDLDRAQLFDLPDADGWSRQQQEDWLSDNNIDLMTEYENNLWTLGTRGMSLNPIRNDRWDTVTATELDKALSEEGPFTNSDITVREQRNDRFHTLNFGVAAPVTFAFKTVEGSSGVLRIIEFSNESRSVTILFKLLKPLKGTAPPTEVRAPETRLHVDVPPGWKVVQLVDVPADQTAAIGKRLGGRIEKLSNDVYLAHGARVQVNVMKCATAEDAAKIHASVLKMKGDPAYCLLMDKTVVEFVGQFDVDFAKRLARELLGMGPYVPDDARVPLTVEQGDRVRAQTLLSIKRILQLAIQMYHVEYGKYPALRDDWAELTQTDGDKGPFLKGEPMNPFTGESTVAIDDSGDWQYDAETHELRAVVPLEKEKADSLGLTSKDVVLKGQGKEGTDSEALAKQVAKSYFDSLMLGDAKKAASLSAVPFSFDRKRTVNTLDELEKLYQEIADTKGSREVTPSRVVAFQGGDDPNITVMMWTEGESISIFVRPGKEYRVVGFSD